MLVFAVTNRKLCRNFFAQIKKISELNIDYLILREKDLEENELLKMALKVKEILNKTHIKLIINKSYTAAKKIECDGIQLSFKDFIEFRENKIKFDKLIGVSIHSLAEGVEAENLGADYVLYGNIFETECKKGLKGKGTSEIKKMKEVLNIPIVCIGGINKDNYKSVIESGASGIAMMSEFMK